MFPIYMAKNAKIYSAVYVDFSFGLYSGADAAYIVLYKKICIYPILRHSRGLLVCFKDTDTSFEGVPYKAYLCCH